jgi:hypothetical protein
MDKYVNDRNNHEKIEPFDWALDLEMNEDWTIWENEITNKLFLKAKANVIKKNKKQKGE